MTFNLAIEKSNVKTSAIDSLWSIAIYFGFRKYFSYDILLNTGDVAVVFAVIVFIFLAGVIVEQ